jgi:adenosylcobinamide-phosphate synthase
MAGALGLALAGPRQYAQLTVDDPWIGDGTAKAEARDIRRALAVYVWACLGNAGLVAAVGVAVTLP